MQLLITLFILCLASLGFSQEENTKNAMQQLGYELIDLQQLHAAQQKQRPCSSCPQDIKSANLYNNSDTLSELQQLYKNKQQLIIAERALISSHPLDTMMVKKYRTALINTEKRIHALELRNKK